MPSEFPSICVHVQYLIPSRLSDHYAFVKPNDRRALDLMNAAAVEVMKELPDLCIAYGISDEFRCVQPLCPAFIVFANYIFQLCLPSYLPALRAAECVSPAFLGTFPLVCKIELVSPSADCSI